MKFKLFSIGLITTIIATFGLNLMTQRVEAQSRYQFYCGQTYDATANQRFPATKAVTTRGKIVLIQWQRVDVPGYSPQQRCREVSPRFQQAYNNGTLNLITNARINGKSVICTTKEYGGDCVTLLLTLQPKDNSLQILNDLRDMLNFRQVGLLKHSSGIPQIYYQIDLEEVMRNAPVEQEVRSKGRIKT